MAQANEWVEKAKPYRLTDPDKLPDLDEETIVIVWDFEQVDGEDWQILRHNGGEIWREYASWESYQRFETVFNMLHDRYGDRLAGLHPSEASELYLYGDKPNAPDIIRALNDTLRPSSTSPQEAS